MLHGELIIFVDADDFLEKNMIEKMVKYYDEKKLIVCSYNIVNENKRKIMKKQPIVRKISIQDTFEYLANRKMIQGYPWNKIFSSSIIKNNNLRFLKNISICEDLCFVAKYLTYIEEVIYIQEGLYNYRVRNDSALADKFNVDKRITVLDAYEYLIDLYENNKMNSSYLKYWILKEAINIKMRSSKLSHVEDIYIEHCERIIDKQYNNIIRGNEIKNRDKLNLIISKCRVKMSEVINRR